MRFIFDWDDRKNARNKAKHGIAFEDVVSIFSDTLARLHQDYEHGEERYAIYGCVKGKAIVVVHTAEIMDDNCTLIRIISARKLTKKELKRYENEL